MEENNYNNTPNPQQNAPADMPNTHMQQPMEDAPLAQPKKGGGMGPLVGIVIIIILLVLGGLYFWGAQLEKQQQDESELFMEDANDDIASDDDEPEEIEEELDEFNSAEFEAQLEADLQALEEEF